VGMGLRSGAVLAVSFEIPVRLTAVYHIDATNRTLTGSYCNFPAGGSVATETLTFSHELKSDWQVGDAMLGNWSYDPFWYPGTILEKEDDRFLVRFADGDEEWLGPSRMMPDRLTVGDMVFQTYGLFHNGDEPTGPGQALPEGVTVERLTNSCRIIHRQGDRLVLEARDGRRDTTGIEYIRTLAPREIPISLPSEDIEQ